MTNDASSAVLRVAFGKSQVWSASIRHGLPPRYAPDFVDLGTADLDAYDAVVPLTRAHAESLTRRPDLRGRKFLHPAPETIALCHDKLALARFLIAEGFGDIVPPLRAPGPPYPYVWKRRQGAGFGRDCHVVDGPGAEAGLNLTGTDSFAQSLVSGVEEFATYILRANGRIHYASTFTHEMSGPDVILGDRNQPNKSHIQGGCRHGDLFVAILERLGYEGVACFDYKVIDGRPQLFEVNPRFGGSLIHDVTAYIDAYVGALEPRGR